MIKSTDFFSKLSVKTLEHHYKPPRALGNLISNIIYRLLCSSYSKDEDVMAISALWTLRVGFSASTFPHLRWRILLLCISCSQGCNRKVGHVLLRSRRQSLSLGTFRTFCQILQSAKQRMKPNSEAEQQFCGLAEASLTDAIHPCTSQHTCELVSCMFKCFACSSSLQVNNYGLAFSHSLNQTSSPTVESIPHWMHSLLC